MRDLEQLRLALEPFDLLEEQRNAVCALQRRMADDELIISVIGQFKRGKSSLINAMLNAPVLPVGIIPLTTAVTEIRYGPRLEMKVCFRDGSCRDILPEELEDYCTEAKNPGNNKMVQTIKLWTPLQPFGSGIVLVDTPGVGSVHENNTSASYAYVAHSDVILFLLSVDSPVSQTEREFLLEAREHAAKFFFAVNKADCVSGEDLEEFMHFCEGVIGEAMETGVSLCAVSAKTGQGVPELTRRLLQELQSSKGQLMQASAEQKLELILRQIRAKIDVAMQTASLPGEELAGKLKRMEAKLGELSEFSGELHVLARHRTGLLVGEIGEALDRQARQLEEETRTQGQILFRQLEELPGREFRERLQAELDSYLRRALSEMNRTGMDMLSRGYGEITALLSQKSAEAGRFISELFRQEFGLDYPVSQEVFRVSEESDFFLQIGIRSLPQMHDAVMERLMPRKTANAHFLQRSLQQAAEDIDCNKNNMVYNYRYKMQESLRPLCARLSGQVSARAADLESLIVHMRAQLEDVRGSCAGQQQSLTRLRRVLDEV